MTQRFRLTPGTTLDYDDGELLVINSETGFTGTGNKYAYEVLRLMDAPTTMDSVIEELCRAYPESQRQRIMKSVPNVTKWALERGIVKEVPSG